MKWTKLGQSERCDPELLGELLDGRLDEPAFERSRKHLDTCVVCQRRLTELSGDARWWIEASQWLESESSGLDAVDDRDEWDDDWDQDGEAYIAIALQRLRELGLLKETDSGDSLGVIGRYRVTRVLGSGGTGLVLRAVDSDLNRVVAIKVLSPNLSVSGAARKRFAREGQAVAAVAHENVVSIHQVEASGPSPYLVMQYVDGQSLQELIGKSGPLDATSALRITTQIAAALEAAHAQGLVHRDVKPANILVGSGGQRIWITDFGLARAVDDASLTRTGFIAGTPHYMSPEQARGETVTESSDLFGLGSVLYFMLTGRPPFRAERTLAILSRICDEPHRPVREVNPDVPPAVAGLIDRLLEKKASGRFPAASEVRKACLRQMTRKASPVDKSEIDAVELQSKQAPAKNKRIDVRLLAMLAVVPLVLIAVGVIVGSFAAKYARNHSSPLSFDPGVPGKSSAVTSSLPNAVTDSAFADLTPRANRPIDSQASARGEDVGFNRYSKFSSADPIPATTESFSTPNQVVGWSQAKPNAVSRASSLENVVGERSGGKPDPPVSSFDAESAQWNAVYEQFAAELESLQNKDLKLPSRGSGSTVIHETDHQFMNALIRSESLLRDLRDTDSTIQTAYQRSTKGVDK